MKIVCMINSLGSGGAQRQICLLAILLKQRGYDVEMYVCFKIGFYESDFFRSLLEQENISVFTFASKNYIQGAVKLRKALKLSKPDVVISYLNGPNLLAELASLPFRNYTLIVSERNLDLPGRDIKRSIRFFCHRLADAVVPNSYAQMDYINKMAPWLARRTKTIINCVDIDVFHPAKPNTSLTDMNIVVLGRFTPQKNPMVLVSAAEILTKKKPDHNIVIDWYGNNFYKNGKPTANSALFLKVQKAIKKAGIENVFHLHNSLPDVVPIYQNSSAVCLPSLYEGCSNVICEALACGKPVLASRVSDNIRLVEEGENGFLFDPNDPEEMANVFLKFSRLSVEERQNMGNVSRRRAESILAPSRFIKEYIELITSLKK